MMPLNFICIFYSIQFENSADERFSYTLTIDQVAVKLGITRYSHIWRFVNFPAVVSRRRSNLETPHFNLCALIHVAPSARHLCADVVRGRACFETGALLSKISIHYFMHAENHLVYFQKPIDLSCGY